MNGRGGGGMRGEGFSFSSSRNSSEGRFLGGMMGSGGSQGGGFLFIITGVWKMASRIFRHGEWEQAFLGGRGEWGFFGY